MRAWLSLICLGLGLVSTSPAAAQAGDPLEGSGGLEPDTDAVDDDPTPVPDAEANAESADDTDADATAPSDDYPDDYPDALSEEPVGEQAPTLRYYFEGLEVRGNERTRESVIANYVPFEEGDVLDPRAEELEDIEWRLRGTGWFRDVAVSLARGSRRGWVRIVVEVVERNTIVVTQLVAGISEGLRRSGDSRADVVPYLGLTVAETNLAGTGARLALSALGSTRAQALWLEYDNPLVLPRGWSLGTLGFFNNGRHYFGGGFLDVDCPVDDMGVPDPDCIEEKVSRNIVVFYRRAGAALTTGHRLGANSRLQLGWQVEVVDPIGEIPTASLPYGDSVRPFVPNLRSELSWLSILRAGIEYDKRDDPSMTTRGVQFRLDSDLASSALGSDYEFLRIQARLRTWAPLPWPGHSLRFSLFLGSVFGDAPFFYQFQIADLTDLVPSQVLQMQLDRRGAPNLLGTSIREMRIEELAGRFDVQYELPLYRGNRRLRRLNAFFNVGLLYLTDPEVFKIAVPGYSGAAKIPVDLTFDVGLRFDSRIGVFQIGFSNILGFLDLFEQ